MENKKYNSKRFLLPILSLVLISIITIASINTYITINMFKKNINEHIKEEKKEFLKEHKKEVYGIVQFVDSAIKYQIETMENRLKNSLKERIQIAIDITSIIYNNYKDKLDKEEIKKRISEALATIRFNDKRGYYFMYNNKTKILFAHPMKKFIGKDMTNYTDAKNRNLMETDAKILEKVKIGFNKIYFNKPDNQNEEFPKITCITKFEPLDIVIGTGEYLDVIQEEAKKYVLQRFANMKLNDPSNYLFILDIHNIEGGDDFATVILNSNRKDLIGNKVSDKSKDLKGNRFRKMLLDNAKRDENGGYTEYWYKKPSTQMPAEKVSYTYLQKDWNWLIGSGFYYDDLEKQIEQYKESMKIQVNETINQTLIWVTILSFIAILIAIFVSLRIDKTIKNYTNKIIKYEENKREESSILIQQSKMASMGEMMESIAHQWRQPLSVISTSSSGMKMQKEFGTLSDKEFLEFCDSITKSTNHLSNTIDDFRDFFKRNKEKNFFDIKEVFQKTKELLVSILKNREIDIIENIEDININGFENELVQVLMNILNNAKDALETKDIKRAIFIDVFQEKNNIKIKIKDNAGGIQEKILPKIFESYFTTKQEKNGTGIGLYMSKKILENSFKGTITAKNVHFIYKDINYSGAEFTISLPSS